MWRGGEGGAWRAVEHNLQTSERAHSSLRQRGAHSTLARGATTREITEANKTGGRRLVPIPSHPIVTDDEASRDQPRPDRTVLELELDSLTVSLAYVTASLGVVAWDRLSSDCRDRDSARRELLAARARCSCVVMTRQSPAGTPKKKTI